MISDAYNASTPRQVIDLFGVPMDLGAARRGAALAPAALRRTGLGAALRRLGYAIEDHGDLCVPAVPPDEAVEGRCRHAGAIAGVCGRLATAIEGTGEDSRILTFGGDHSVSIGSIGGQARRRRTSVLWFDAHGDFNTPATTPSGNVHGMPLAVLCGLGDARLRAAVGRDAALRAVAVVLIGVRSLDPGERRLLTEHGVLTYPMDAIRRRGLAAVTTEAIGRVMDYAEALHVSLDPDVLDPSVAPGAGTAVPGGMTAREACAAMSAVAASGALRSMDVVEVNPLHDPRGRTSCLAAALTLTAFGAPPPVPVPYNYHRDYHLDGKEMG